MGPSIAKIICMSKSIRFVVRKLALLGFLSALYCGPLPNLFGQGGVMNVGQPTDAKGANSKSELAQETTTTETPKTLRIVIALLLGAAVVAVVCVPTRKGGGDER